MTDFLVAALQITSTSNVQANFAEAEEQIELASRRGSELIGLPENFAFLGERYFKMFKDSNPWKKINKSWRL